MFTHQYELERMSREIPNERIRNANNERLLRALSKVTETRQPSEQQALSTSRRPLLNPLVSWVLQLIRQ